MIKAISGAGLRALDDYQYRAGLSGWLDNHVMNPFWNWSINFFPMWIAPNLMTTLSLSHGVAAWLLFLWHTPNMEAEAPQYVYYAAAWLMFMYQFLDALDGKQARRTKSSSPLGQLFDHGCDAICAVLTSLVLCHALGTGRTFLSLMILLLHIVPFFTANWEAAHTDIMRFGVIGVTEAQFLIMGILAAAGYLGQSFWKQHVVTVMGKDLDGVHVLFTGVAVIAAINFIESVAIVARHYSENADDNKSSHAWLQMGQFLLFVGSVCAWALSPSHTLLQDHTVMFMWTVGFVFCYVVSRLIVCHVTHMIVTRVYSIILPLPFIAINSWARHYYLSVAICQPLLLQAYFVFVLSVYAIFVHSVISQICTYLGISCFTIPLVELEDAASMKVPPPVQDEDEDDDEDEDEDEGEGEEGDEDEEEEEEESDE